MLLNIWVKGYMTIVYTPYNTGKSFCVLAWTPNKYCDIPIFN